MASLHFTRQAWQAASAQCGLLRVLDRWLMKHNLLPPDSVNARPVFVIAQLDGATTRKELQRTCPRAVRAGNERRDL